MTTRSVLETDRGASGGSPAPLKVILGASYGLGVDLVTINKQTPAVASITLDAGGTLTAPESTITVSADSGVDLAPGSLISSSGSLQVGGNVAMTPGGVTIDVPGQINSPTATIQATSDDDITNLDRGSDTTPTTVNVLGSQPTVNFSNKSGAP